MSLEIQRRSITQRGKCPPEKNPNEVHPHDQASGVEEEELPRSESGQGLRDREGGRKKKRIPELVTAQLRKDAVIGASATRGQPWWRGAIDSRERASRVIRLACLPRPCTCFCYSNPHGKFLTTREIHGWCTPVIGAHGRVYATKTSFLRMGCGERLWWTGKQWRAGLWVDEPWLSIWKGLLEMAK